MVRPLAVPFTIALLALAPAAVAQEPARPVARDRVAGTYSIDGRFADGTSYAGTVEVVERDGGAYRAIYALTRADGEPVVRPEAAGAIEAGALVLRWSEGGRGIIPGLEGRGRAQGDAEARYSLAAGRGAVTLEGQPYARERLERLVRLIVLHTNDHHGQLIPFRDVGSGRRVGGLAARATVIRRVRREAARSGAQVLVLDAGDINTGVPESDLLDATPDLEAMNAIGYQAMAVGNHEFDRGLSVLSQQRRIARFPFLSANVLSAETGEVVFQPTLVLERDGLRVGILGLTTESTEFISLPENRAGLRFEPALEAAAREVPRLRSRCDVLIALTHLGYYPDGQYGTSTPGDVSLVRAVPGIDLVVGGHTHTPLPQPAIEAGVMICQCQDRGRYVGRVDLLLDASKRIVDRAARLLPVVVEDPADPSAVVEEDAGVRDVLAPFLKLVNGRLDKVLCDSPVVLDGERAHVRSGDTNLAFLVTDAYRAAGETDVAFAIGGGIRASIDQGPVTYREVLTVLPFQNGLVRGELTGAELLEVLAIGARQVAPSGGWLHVSGLTWTVDGGEPRDVRVGGQPLDPARTYTVACDRFVGDGGERYTPFKAMVNREELPLVDNVALERFLEQRGIPDYSNERRCTVRSSPELAPASGSH